MLVSIDIRFDEVLFISKSKQVSQKRISLRYWTLRLSPAT